MGALKEIYTILKAEGLCATQAEFSQKWLGRSAHYMSQIGGESERASLTSLHLLASRLELATLNAKSSAKSGTYRKIRSAYVASHTIWLGEFGRRNPQHY